VRVNREGRLYTRTYGNLIAEHVDPVEKKPLYHFYPGTRAYSIATPGCNFRCQWCQNWEISQNPTERHFSIARERSPGDVVETAERNGCRSIAYTYTEPTIFFEFSLETAKVAEEAGLANLYITNGYMTEEMLEKMHPHLDAANVDLKAFRDETYRKYVGARLQPVLDALRKMHELGIWLEVTTLIIPDINDDEGELREAAEFIVEELGPETPWHLSRFHPTYKLTDVPPTPPATLRRARKIGQEVGLHHVYLGNVTGETNTVCSECGKLLVRRVGFHVVSNTVTAEGACPECGTSVAGVGMAGGRGA
jgi:pyruvate formate lyase activating enzyme